MISNKFITISLEFLIICHIEHNKMSFHFMSDYIVNLYTHPTEVQFSYKD